MAIDNDKLHEFLGKFVTDLGATVAAGGVVIGHNLGLYRALAGEPATAEELADRTHTNPRYVGEWLRGQAAGGYVSYDADADSYSMTEEQAFVLTDPDGAVYAPGAFILALGALKAEPRITEAFRTGGGFGWHEHDTNVFIGCEQFFRPGYIANLIPSWIPSLTGVEDKLRAGADRRRRRLRARCVHDPARAGVPELAGSLARTTTKARSSSRVSGRARPASPTGSASRSARPPNSLARTTTWSPRSTACTTWAIPLSAARHVREVLKPDGSWLVVEPAAADDTAGNMNPVGRAYYNFSTLLCVPNALSQPGGYALGAQAGEAAIRRITTDAGFTRFRRAAETPFNMVYEVRP